MVVDPLRELAESGARGHFRGFLWAVFVRTLGPNGFAGFQAKQQRRTGNIYPLAAQGFQVHLDAALFGIPQCQVLEVAQLKIRAEFAIDSGAMCDGVTTGERLREVFHAVQTDRNEARIRQFANRGVGAVMVDYTMTLSSRFTAL